MAALHRLVETMRADMEEMNARLKLGRSQEQALKAEIRKLERDDRRGTVNMEYLKNVFVRVCVRARGCGCFLCSGGIHVTAPLVACPCSCGFCRFRSARRSGRVSPQSWVRCCSSARRS
jgi:hypothetical protein